MRKWTKEEEKKLETLYHKGTRVIWIADTLNRNKASVSSKLQNLGLKRKEPGTLETFEIPEDPRIKKLEEQVKGLLQRKRIVIHNFFGGEMRIGVVSDSHIGSLYERTDILEAAYDVFEGEKLTAVYHAGDICEGENMFRGQEYEIYAHGSDAQVKEAIKKYPRRSDIKTYFITGSHDLSFFKRSGTDIGEQIAKQREDMIYIGREVVDVMIGKKDNTVRMRLVHPRWGTQYALSYGPQKYIEALAGGQKPEIVFFGHTHKAEYMPCYRNIFSVQCGCTQSQTPFMAGKNLAAHMGFWVVEFSINKPNLVSRFKTEFYAVYEERETFKI